MVFIGYFLALFMGLTLGLIGAGGSILTVPILVYFLKVKPVVATGYSLLVVGSAALLATVSNWHQGRVRLRTTLAFAIPAMLAVLATRAFLIPSIPETIGFVPKDTFIMLLFVILMFAASLFMLRPVTVNATDIKQHKNVFQILAGAIGVGVLTGLVGAGGGFLIVPSLIAFFGLAIKEAIGTSLAVIAINSLVGLNGDIHSGLVFDWSMLLLFLGFTYVGIFLGSSFGKKLEAPFLKRLFAYFILVISAFILALELYRLGQ